MSLDGNVAYPSRRRTVTAIIGSGSRATRLRLTSTTKRGTTLSLPLPTGGSVPLSWATLEMNGYSFQNGGYTNPTLNPLQPGRFGSGGDTYFNIGPGLRKSVCNYLDYGAAVLFPVTQGHWADPLFRAITHNANPALADAQAQSPVTVTADPNDCRVQFNPVGTAKFTSTCDVAKSALVKAGVPYSNVAAPAGTAAQVQIGLTGPIASYDAKAADAKSRGAVFDSTLASALKAAGYPAKADPARINKPMLVLLLWILVIYVTMVYGPIAAMLVEMFPTRIRYTSMSLPYHIANGWFGGFLPPIAFAIVASTGNIYSGLWYPVIVATLTVLIGGAFVKETVSNDITSADPSGGR